MLKTLFQYLDDNQPTHEINGDWWSIMSTRINYFNEQNGTNFDTGSSLLEYIDQQK